MPSMPCRLFFTGITNVATRVDCCKKEFSERGRWVDGEWGRWTSRTVQNQSTIFWSQS